MKNTFLTADKVLNSLVHLSASSYTRVTNCQTRSDFFMA